ncbi:MAG TPA: pseudouridine-5'-phosphate glycosidase [Mycobacteriales bacterium]
MSLQLPSPTTGLDLGEEVADALRRGAPVVALESTILSHGLPRPRNLEVGRQIEETVRAAGAVPATIGLVGGRVVVGLDDAQVERLCTGDDVQKVSIRDLPLAVARGVDGATTVASTSALAARVGIGVFATGGLGGVHRGFAETHDESADLGALAATPITVVCAGVKSILDVAATLERLETLSVGVVGYRTDRFPGFYLGDSGYGLDWRVDSPAEVAAVVAARDALGLPGALVVANPLPVAEQLDPALHDRVLAEGLAGLEREGVTGKDVTPYLLAHFHEATHGESLDVNVRLVLRNADLAARIAVASARQPTLSA